MLWIIVGIVMVVIVGVFSYMLGSQKEPKILYQNIENKDIIPPMQNTTVSGTPLPRENQAPTPVPVIVKDWKKEYERLLPNTPIRDIKDITGDGVPEVLVSSFAGQGGSGISTFDVVVFTINNNKAVEIPVYENGVKRGLSQYSGNVEQTKVYFSDVGLVEENRRGTPGVYENLVRKTVFIYNKNTGRLENTQ